MKILIVSNKFPPNAHGGYEISAGVAAKTLVAQGHQVVVATSKHDLGPWDSAPEAKVHFPFRPLPWYDAVEISRAVRSLHLRPWLHNAFSGSVAEHDAALSQLVATERPDLIWAFNLVRIGPLGIMHTCLRSGVPTLFHFQDNVDQELNDYATKQKELEAFRVLKTQAFALFCSQLCAKYNSILGKYASSRVVPSYGPSPFTPAPAFHFYTPPETLHIVHMGTLGTAKGTGITVDGFTQLARKFPGRLRLHLIGGGDPSFIQQLQHPDIELLGSLEPEAVLARVARCHVAVLPLRTDEPFGLVALEAVRAGCVSLIGANAGVTEILDPYHNYLPLYSRTSTEIACALENILQSPQDYHTLSLNAWRSPRILTPDLFVRQVLELKDSIPVPHDLELTHAGELINLLASAPSNRSSRLSHY